jgi:POT family proton-dependent oligopeptide transporter
LNFFVAFGIPVLTTVALALVALSHETTPLVRFVGWVGLGSVGFSYLLILAMSILGKFELSEGFWQAARKRCSESEISAARSVGPILFIFTLMPVFWALFDQTFSTWVLQGEKLNPFQIGNWVIGPEEMQSSNPLLVIILIPIMTWWLYPRLGRLATPLRRMSAGMFLGASSFIVVAMLQSRIEAGEQLSVLWQFVPYLILTVAEVLVSTTGLEFAFREGTKEMKSIIIGFWWVTVAVGNLLVSTITKVLSGTGAGGHEGSVSTPRFLLYAGLLFLVAVLFSIVATRYRYRDEAAARGL